MSSVREKARRGLAVVGLLVTLVAGAFSLLILMLDSQLEPMRAESANLFESIKLSRDVRAAYVVVAEQMIAHEPLTLANFAELPGRIERLKQSLPAQDRELVQRLAEQWGQFERSLEEDSHSVESAAEALSHAADRVATAELGRALVRQRDAGLINTATAIFGPVALLGILIVTVLMVRSLSTQIVAPLSRLSREVDAWRRGEPVDSYEDQGLEEVAAVFQATHAQRAELIRREREHVADGRLAAIGQLAAGVAHEMNNPIAVIRGYIQTMTPETRDEAKALKRVSEQLDACAEVVRALLSATKPRRTRQSLAGEVRRIVPDADIDESLAVEDLDRWLMGFGFLTRTLQHVSAKSVGGSITVDGSFRQDTHPALWLELAREFISEPIVQTPSGYRIEISAVDMEERA